MIDRYYEALVADLASVVDLTGGVDDAMQQRHLSDIAVAVSEQVNLDAGLAEIVGLGAPRAPAESVPWPSYIASQLATIEAVNRFELRDKFIYLHDSLMLARHLAALEFGTRGLMVWLNASQRQAPSRLRRRESVIRIRTDLLRFESDVAQALYWVRSVAVRVEGEYVKIARELEGGLTQAAAIVHDLKYGGHIRRGGPNRLGSQLVRSAHVARTLAVVSGGEVLKALGGDVVVELSGVRNLADGEVANLAEVLEGASYDFADADLTAVSLGNASLNGIRWSESTLWPTEWNDLIRAASEQIRPGLYRIIGWGNRVPSATVLR